MAQPVQPENSQPPPQIDPALPVPLLYRDAMMLVIDKPAGLPVHRGPQAKRREVPVLTDHLDALRFGLPRRPELAHRLDKDTSGCLVLGRHPRAMAELNQMFRDGRIGKTYWAIVQGAPADDEGLIDLPLARRSPDRGWWMKVDPAGLPSQTGYRVLGRGQGAEGPLAWLALEPLTGRTHQLRVHMKALGHPILDDEFYAEGEALSAAPRLMLHAQEVAFRHPDGRDVIYTVPSPF